MEFDRKELLGKLNVALIGTTISGAVDQSDCFIFRGDRISSYNDDMAVTTPFETGIEGAIGAMSLKNLLEKMTEEKVTIDMKEGENEVSIKASRKKAGMPLRDTDSPIFAMKMPEDDEWQELPSNFVKGVRQCLNSVSKKFKYLELTGIHFFGEIMESCDKFRLTRTEMKGLPFSEDIIIPGSVCAKIVALNPTQYVFDPVWAHFMLEDGTTVSCRTIANLTFPNTDNLAILDEGETIVFPNKLVEILDRACVFSEEDVDSGAIYVKMIIADDKIVIRGENTDGWFEEECRMRYKGDEIIVYVNPVHFIHILNSLSEAIKGVNKMKFTGDDFIQIITLGADDGGAS